MTNQNHAMSSHDVDASRAVAFDAGLRAYMIRVYNYMIMGVGLTGVVAWLTLHAAVVTDANGAIVGRTSFGEAIIGGPVVLVRILGTLLAAEFLDLQVQPKAAASAERGTP